MLGLERIDCFLAKIILISISFKSKLQQTQTAA